MPEPILIRPDRCIGCSTCEVACSFEKGGSPRVKVIKGEVNGYPVFCRHCETALCVSVCYVGALKVENGFVLINEDLCTRCGLCSIACPFGAISISLETNFPEKCDACYNRQKSGKQPVCVLACPSGALVVERVSKLSSRKRFIYARMLQRNAKWRKNQDTHTLIENSV